MPERTLVSRETAIAFFRDALIEALRRERVDVAPMAEFYVVNLLVSQIHAGCHPDDILALRLSEAMQRSTPMNERARILRSVGDAALVSSGLWWERDEHPRRLRMVPYLRHTGRFAYRHLGTMPVVPHPFDPPVYRELAQKFEQLADVLARLAASLSLASSADILRLVSLWEHTRSRFAAVALAEQGVTVSRSQSTTPS